jgi:ubiquinone/menaquinone biosynthesis C-methylase UbiE
MDRSSVVPDLENVRRGWDLQAITKTEVNQMVGRFLTPDQRQSMIEDIRRKLELQSNHNLLDVGCGNANILVSLRSHVKKMLGTDLSQDLLKVGKTILPYAPLICAQSRQLPFVESAFDRVLCYSVFHYFPSENYARDCLRDLCRVCRTKGLVLVGDLPSKGLRSIPISSRWEVTYRLKVLLRRHPGPSIHNPLSWRFYDLRGLARFIESLGYQVEVLEQPADLVAATYRRDLLIHVHKK